MKQKYSGYVICNTSPLLYLHQLRLLWIIPEICEKIYIPPAIVIELNAGKEQGVEVPDVSLFTTSLFCRFPDAIQYVIITPDLLIKR